MVLPTAGRKHYFRQYHRRLFLDLALRKYGICKIPCLRYPRILGWIAVSLLVTYVIRLCLTRDTPTQRLSSLKNEVYEGWPKSMYAQHTSPSISFHRKFYESKHDPNDWRRIKKAVQAMQVTLATTAELRNCPREPPSQSEYPQTWPLLDILQAWHPDDIKIPTSNSSSSSPVVPFNLFHSLCILDWEVHGVHQVEAYQKAEIPFVLRSHPEVLKATERWNAQVPKDNVEQDASEPYFLKLFRDYGLQLTEKSKGNHFLFWRRNHLPDNFVPPTEEMRMEVDEWHEEAKALEREVVRNSSAVTIADHYYYMVQASPGDVKLNTLFDELPIFRADVAPTFFTRDRNFIEQRGLNCRLGMIGNQGVNHFDASRNWIVLLKGIRRYILSPPEMCQNLDLWPLTHVSGRHSKTPWSDLPNTLKAAKSLQVILQAGEALYLPTSWFHHITSLTTTIQCNARSGTMQYPGSRLDRLFQQCGFDIYS